LAHSEPRERICSARRVDDASMFDSAPSRAVVDVPGYSEVNAERARFTHVFDRHTLALDSLRAIATSERGAKHARQIAEAALRIDDELARGPALEEEKSSE
jgi:hypothetical protein